MSGVFVLVLAILTIESSYLEEIERPVKEVPDTVQYWISPENHWRIKTFAIDHDIHIYRLGLPSTGLEQSTEFFEANIRKSYGDVIGTLGVLRFEDPNDREAVSEILKSHGLAGSLEVSDDGFAFYKPDEAKYRTQSKPK